MKEVTVICPKCGHRTTYKNWFVWVWRTPFHHFSKRWTKCTNCSMRSLIRKEREK